MSDVSDARERAKPPKERRRELDPETLEVENRQLDAALQPPRRACLGLGRFLPLIDGEIDVSD